MNRDSRSAGAGFLPAENLYLMNIIYTITVSVTMFDDVEYSGKLCICF